MQIDKFFITSFVFVLLGFIGFFISFYIFRKKNTKKKLICPVRTNCELVTNSDYSVVGPFRVEVLGVLYYSIMTALYLFVYFYIVWTPLVNVVFVVLSGVSVLFSLYLMFVQSFLIRQWCIWCMSSALVSIFMFLLVLSLYL